jgi:hypothetical protein
MELMVLRLFSIHQLQLELSGKSDQGKIKFSNFEKLFTVEGYIV